MAVTGMTQMGDAQTEIEKMYQQYLGRASDQGGLDYYTNLASSGRSMDYIRDSISGSPEAQAYTPPPPPAPTQPGLLNFANSGPVQASTNMANPNFAAGQQGNTVGGIGNTTGMGQDINWSAPTTATLSAGQVFSTPAGDYQAVDNGFGQIGLSAMDGAAQGSSDIIYNMAYGNNHFGVNPNTGEAWYQEAQGTTPGLYDTSPASQTVASTPPPAASVAPPSVSVADVSALYQTFLGRPGAENFLLGWANSGLSIDQIAEGVANSPEGVAYADAQAASAADATSTTTSTTTTDTPTTDNPTPDTPPSGMTLDEATSYVTGLYQSILGRAPKQAGLDYWVNDLMSGATAADVQSNIFYSPEFGGRANSEVSGYFTSLTGAAGDPSQIASYVGEAQAQAKSLSQIYQEIYNSDAAKAFRDSQSNTGLPPPPPPPPPAPGDVPTGSQATVQSAADDTQTYDATQAAASADAGAEDAQVAARTVTPDELVENRINNLLDSNNPYIQRARTSGLQFANRRGLLNSSIAAQASEEAAIARAGEIASQDAATYAQAALANQQAQNTAGLQDAQLGTNVSMFNVGEDNTTNRFNAQSVNEAGQFNAAAANQAIQNFLQREQVRLLQDDSQAFTAEQNEADRVLRKLLQDEQFDFTSSENALDRGLQTALQDNQFAFQGGENALDRDQQTALQNSQFSFQGVENAADRATQLLIADKEISFRTWSQSNEQQWQSAQNALQLEFQYYGSNAQTATSIMYSTMEGVAQIYADPNLTEFQKQNAIKNLLDSANSMPQLLSTIQANVTAVQQTNAATNYDENGVWIGEGYPNWAVPPSGDGEYEEVVTPIVNPNTGQTYNAPNAGWTYLGQTTEEGAGTGVTPENQDGNFTGDPSTLVFTGSGIMGLNLYLDPATGKYYQLVDGEYVPPGSGQQNTDRDGR